MVQSELAFGRFRLQPERQLLVDGKPVPLGSKPLNILSALLQARGDLVTKDELIERVWPGMVVEENTLQAHISAIRKTLGEEGRWIATVPGRGYRFAGPAPGSSQCDPPDPPTSSAGATPPLQPAQPDRPRHRWRILAGGLLFLGLAAVAGLSAVPCHRPAAPKALHVERYLVQPFVNRTGDPRKDDFADVLSDAVASRIAAMSWDSEVVGHNQSFAYKGRPIDEVRLAGQLGLDFIIEGSLLSAGTGVEASATLVDGATGTQIATLSAHAATDDIVTERQALVSGIVDQVRYTLYRRAQRLIETARPDDSNIRDLLIRAEASLDNSAGNSDARAAAAALVAKALTLDPRNVHALCISAQLSIQFVNDFAYSGKAERDEALVRAEAPLAEAVRLEPDRSAIHLMLADLRSAQGRHDAARAEFQRVLNLDPASAWALDGLALEDIFMGQPEAALEKLDRARLLNPGDLYLIDLDLAVMRLNLGQDAEALDAIRQAVTIETTDTLGWAYLTGLLQLTHHQEEARAALATLRKINPAITIAKLRLDDVGASAPYRQSQERVYAALREAGLPEDSAP